MTPTTDQQLLRVDQVARYLNVRDRTIREWCREGLIRHVRLPHGAYRIPPTELDRLTKGNNHDPR